MILDIELTQSICKACMAVEKSASYTEHSQVGEPAPWNATDYTGKGFRDEDLWKEGKVFCPHLRCERLFDVALRKCLRHGAQKAAAEGVLVISEEENAD